MDEIEIITAECGAPAVKVHAMLDWFDGQIAAAESAKVGETDVIALAFLDAQIEHIQDLKDDLVASTLESMDVSTGS